MTGRVYLNPWPRRMTLLITLLIFAGGWWWEQQYLPPPGRQYPTGELATGEYEVQRVVDGDTLILAPNNLRVRLQGIDTPETVQKGTPVEPWGPEASLYSKQFLESANWRVRVEIIGEPVDRHGRHLAFVWHAGRLLNEELVLRGLARAKLNYDYSEPMKQRLRQAQLEAQAANRGIWSK